MPDGNTLILLEDDNEIGTGQESSQFGSSAPRSIGVLKLAFIAYFLVCGGPYGVEIAVQSAGPFLTLIFMIVLPVIWVMPQVMMAAELSSLLPENGGAVVWVQTAFGSFAGFVAGFNGILSNISDMGLYPFLVAAYAENAFGGLTEISKLAVKLTVIALSLVMNLYGVHVLSLFSMIVTIAIMLPFLFVLVWKSDLIAAGGSSWASIPPKEECDWGVFLSTILWAFSGWDSLGSFAGEVQNPGPTIIRAAVVTVALVLVTYVVPLIVGIQTHPNLSDWDSGAFGKFMFEFSPALGLVVTLASILANFNLYNAGLAQSSRQLWAFAGGSGMNEDLMEAFVPRVFATTWIKYNSPSVSIITHSVLLCFLLFFSFKQLVQASMMLLSIKLLFEFGALIKLRLSWADRERPYKVPGGWLGVWMITIPKLTVVVFIISTMDRVSFWSGLFINACASAIFVARVVITEYTSSNPTKKWRHQQQSQREDVIHKDIHDERCATEEERRQPNELTPLQPMGA